MSTSTVKLPASVQAQLDRAEQIEQEMASPPAPDPTPDPPAEEPPAPEPDPPPAPPAPPPEDFEQKYRSLKGKYDREVPALQAQVTQLTGQVSELTAKLNDASKPADTPKPAVAPAPKLVTDKDIDNFGPDLIDLIGRKAREIAAEQTGEIVGELQTLRAENAALKAKVEGAEQTVAKTSFETFIGKLRERIPDLDEVNATQSFLDWCMGEDELRGGQRQQILAAAMEAQDVQRVVNFVNAWRATQSPPPAPASAPAKDPKVEAEFRSQVAPGSSKTPPSPPPAPKVWKAAEINAFYADVTRGKYRGRDAEFNAIEAEINQAIAEGRVSA